MEDQGNSGTKKVQRSSVKIEDNDGPLFSGAHIDSPNNNQNYLFFELKEGLSHLSLKATQSNNRSINRLKNNQVLSFFNQDVYRKCEKNLQGFKKVFEKNLEHFSNKKELILPFVNRSKTVNLLHSELFSWNTALRHLVSMPSLSEFNVCQVLCHEKGTTNVISYSLGSEGSAKESKTSIESFNKVFNQIKKSKGRQFSQTQLTIPEFDFTGSFLASIFQFKTHNILFLLSDNSFFPIGESSIHEFKLLNKQIGLVLNKVINKELLDSKISNLSRVFETIPVPLAIVGPMGNFVFQNIEYKDISSSENSDPSNNLEIYLNNGYQLQLFINTAQNKSDIQHFQRVGLLGELLNTLQHELSNPLFGIQLATDFLKLNPNNDEAKESLGEVSEYCKRCQDILRDFKFIYQDGDKFVNVYLEKLIKETLTLTKSASRGIEKIIQIDPKLNIINTNPTWLSQIIFNLVINSSQAIESSKIKNGQIIIKAIKEDGAMLIEVKDNGPGIKDGQFTSVFDPFFTTKEKGTGLGLSICKNLSEKLGGSITFQKEGGRGAVFLISLPADSKDSNEKNTID